MKFCVSFLLLLLFDTLQGSTLSHVRKVRSLNTTLQTNFNGTYERRNPCTNAEVESSSYIASHEFHHHTCEDNWSDYTHKCSAIISGFLQAIGNLVRFNNKQNGLFNFHINTSISQKQVGDRNGGKCRENMPTILIEATDCQVTPRTNTEDEGKYDGPVCLLNKRNKAGPRMVSKTNSCEQNADTIKPPVINSNQEIPQNEFQETEKNLKQDWNPSQTSLGGTSESCKGPQIVLNDIAPPANEQTSAEIETSTTSLSQSESQVIPVTTSYEPPQPNFGLGNSPGFQATSFENANEETNFNPPADIPNMPFEPQPVVPISNEEQINQNQLPAVLPDQQGLPAVYPPQPSNDNLDGQVPGPSYSNQMPELLPPSQAENIPQGGPGYPQNSPAFIPTNNGQNPNLQYPGNYPPPLQQAAPMENSLELPPTDNNEPSQVGFTEASGQISDMTQTVDSFTQDQQQPVTPKQTETAYYNDGPMTTVPSQEIQPEFLPPKPLFFSESQQKLPQYPPEMATNEQTSMRPKEVLPSDSVDPKDAAFADSPVIPNGGVGNTFNLPVAKSFEPVIPPNSQLPIAPALTTPQDRQFEQQYTTSSSVESMYQSQREGIPEFQVPPNQMPGPSEMSGNPPISNQPAPNTFIQPVPVGNFPSSNNFAEQARNEFDGPQQPDSTDLRPVESTPFQPIPTLGPQPSPDVTQQLPRNEMFGPVPQNFQGIVPVDAVPVQSSPVVGPPNDIAPQTAMEDSKFDYPTSTERPEQPSASGLVPNNIGNQLSELTTNNKPVLNSNDFQPETQSYFTEPSDRNLDITTQTPFYDSIPAVYKSEPESQPGLIPSVQNLPERPTAPAPKQAFPPSGLETFPATPELPTPTPEVTTTEPYSEQIRPEFGSTPTNPEFVNPPRNGFQMFSPRPNPRFIPREQYFGDDRQTVAMQQPNPTPEISNPLDTNQPPLENNPVVPEQQQPQFYPNQNGVIQQPFPESAVTSQPSGQMETRQEFETTGFTAVYPQPPTQPGIPNYDVQSGNQAQIRPNVPNYDVQSGNQAQIQPGVPNYDVQPRNQVPIQSDVSNYDFQQRFQSPVQPGVPINDVQSENQAQIRPNVPNYDDQSVNPAPIQPDVPNYDVQPGNQAPVQQDVPNYDVQQGNQAPIQSDVPNYAFQQRFQSPIQPGVQINDIQSGNQAPIQPGAPNYDVQPGFQPPVQPDVQPGNQYPIQPGVPNYDVQSGNQAQIQPDIPNYNGQRGNQAQIQPNIPNYNSQAGNQAPIQPDVPNYEIQPGNQSPIQSGTPNYEIQPGNQPPNAPVYYPERRSDEFYPEPPQNENQPFQAGPQSVLPYQAPTIQIPSAESQEQIINPETASVESVSNTDLVSTIPPSAPGAGDSLPNEYPSVEQQSTDFDGSQIPQQNYPNPGFPSPQAPVYLPATQATAPQYFPAQSDSNLNYDGVQPEQQIPGNDQFPPQTDSNLQPVTFPSQVLPMNTQNGVNSNEFQTFVPSAPSQQTGATPFPLPPLQTIPENSQVNSFPVGSETSPAPEVPAQGMDNVMFNPNQPAGVSQPQLQDLSTQDQFTTAVPLQFTTESSGEVTTDYRDQYRPRPSEDNFSGVPGVQTTNQMITSIDEYQNPGPTTQEPLSYFQERPDDVRQTTPPPFQADQFLTSTQSQFEYVQNNAAMYSPNLAPRPQPQPSFDNLTEFPGDKTAGSTTQTPLPSEIKPETFGSQPPRQRALTETNIPDTDNTKTLDTQPNSGTLDYLGPQIYPNFDVPAPAVNYPRQDRRSFPPTADSITRDMTYQTTIPAFSPSLTVPTYGINPIEMVFNSNSSYSSTAMIPSEGLEKQPFRQASALIASPQPQPTTVKYSEQIIIPQYQMPTASNPQPQADPNSGNNTKEGLLDSVAWTYTGPQEAMGTVPQPQYQTTPLRSQFPPDNVELNNENIGGTLLPGQKQLVPVTPSFEQEDFSNGKTTTKIVQEVLTTDFPVELESPLSVEDQLARADKLLNSNTRIQEYDQRMGQGPQIQFSPMERRAVTESSITPSPSFQYPLAIQNQPQMQTSSLTSSEQIDTNSSTSRLSLFQEDKIQVLPQFQSFPSKNISVHTTDSLLSPPPTFQEQIQDQPQPQGQSSSTNIREKLADSPVTSPLPLPKQFYAQPQTQHQPFSSTISREIITDSLVTPPLQSQIQNRPQQKLQGFASTNFRGVVTEPQIITPSPFEHQTDAQPQPEQRFSSTTSKEVITDSFVTLPPSFQPQTEDQLQTLPSTNMREIAADSSVIPPVPLPQQINVQTRLQPYSLTISKESETDSLATPPPPFQARIEGQPQPKVEELDSTNIRKDVVVNPVTPPPPPQQEIEIQSQPQLQTFSSTIMKEERTVSPVSSMLPMQSQTVVRPQLQSQSYPSINRRVVTSDSLLPSPRPSFQPQNQIQPQSQPEELDSTNIREDVAANIVTPPPTFQQETDVKPQTELQPFSATISRETVTDSLLTPPPPVQPQTVDRSQLQFQSFPSTNRRVGTTDSLVPRPPFEQQIDAQPQTQLQPFSSTTSREVITDSFVSPPHPFEPQTEDQTQPQFQFLPSTNTKEIVPDSSVNPPLPLPQQINVQTQLQPYSLTISRETVTSSLMGQPSPFQPKIEDQPQPQIEVFDSTNNREDAITAPFTTPPPFQQDTNIQPQTDLQVFPSTNIKEVAATSTNLYPTSPFPRQTVRPLTGIQYPTTTLREDVSVSAVTPPPSVQQQTHVQPQPQLESFPSTKMKEIIADRTVSFVPPNQPLTVARPQFQFQSFPINSLVPPPPFERQTEIPPKPNLRELDSTNIREDVAVNPVTPPSPIQQKNDVGTQTEFQQFSSTISREIVSDSFKSQPRPLQPQIEFRDQPQLEKLDSTNIREDVAIPPATPLAAFQQENNQLQTELQPFSSTISREVVTDSLVTPQPPLEPQVQSQRQLQPFPSTNIKEVMATNSVVPIPPFSQQIVPQPQTQLQYPTTIVRKDQTVRPVPLSSSVQQQTVVQPQSRLQSFPSTNMREIKPDSPVIPPPQFPQEIDQPQTELQSFSSTTSREIVTDSLVTPPTPFQPQIEEQLQPQAKEFYTTNIREDTTAPPDTPQPPIQPQIVVPPQLQFQSFPPTNIRVATTDPLVPPSPLQPQIQVLPQPRREETDSTNIRGVITEPEIITPSPFEQQTDAQPQPEQRFSSTTSREVITDSFVTLPPSFQPQTEDQLHPELQTLPSTNMREITAYSSVIPPVPLQQQINVQTRLQPHSLTISREIETDSLATSPPPFQPQIQDQPQPQVQEFDSTNIREGTTALLITRTSPLQKLTNVQPQPPLQSFPSTKTREIITERTGFSIPPIRSPIAVRPQSQFPSFPSTNIRAGVTGSLVPPPPFQSQIQVPPQPNLKEFDSTNIGEVMTEPQIITPPVFEQQTDAQPQPEPQPFSSTVSRDIVTDSLVSRPPTFQTQIEDQPQLQVDSTNIREDVALNPVTPPLTFQRETDVKPQTELQPYSATMSRETVTDTLLTQSAPLQSQIVNRPQFQFQSFPSTKRRVVTSNSLLSPFQLQIQVRPQPQPEELDLTNVREDLPLNPVAPSPPFQQETDVQSQTELQPFSATRSREIVTDSLLTPSPPVQPRIVRPQLQFQSFPLANIRVVTANSPVPPPPFEEKTEARRESNFEGFESTNIREVVTKPSVTAPSPLQQQNDAQLQTVLQPYSSSTSRELITDSVVTPPPSRFQPQIQVRPQQQFQIISSTNTREDISDSRVTVPPVFEQQTNDLPQTQLQPLSSTMSKKIVTDSLVSQASSLQPQNEVQSEPQFLPPSPNMRGIMSNSLTSQPPPVQQLLQNQPQPRLQLISSRKIMTGPLVRPPRPFPRQMEVQAQPELKTFSSVVPAISYVYPPTPLQQAVEIQRQRDLRNFPSRNITAAVSNSPVGVSVSLQGAREQVQNQMYAFPARNREIAIASLPNPAAKLGENVARELQTQRTRYTTTKTKEVITESILPTSNSVYVESGKDGQLKAVEIRSDSKGNHGKKRTEVVEETIATDFPPATEFSSLEDEFILADKLLNSSTPILNTTSYVKVSPLVGNSEKVVTIVDEPTDQISVKRKSENSVPLSMSTPVNYNPKYSQSGLANKPNSLPRGSTVSPDFQTSERDVLYTSPMSSDYQDDYEEASQWNPLLHTLETHLNFPLHEPPQVPSTTPGPRRASPLPLLSHFYPNSPIKTRRRNSWPDLEIIKNSGSAGQEMKTGPRHDPPVPVFNPTDPSNGPDPLKELILKNHDLVLKNAPNVMAPGPRRENF